MTANERKVFQAVAKVQARTGLPILTHNAYLGARSMSNGVPRDAAIRQLDVLESAGAKTEHVAIGHVCCLDDPQAGIPIELTRRGAFLRLDPLTIPLFPPRHKTPPHLTLRQYL